MTITEEAPPKIYIQNKIANLIKRLGHPPAVILLDSHCKTFTISEVEGFIGYRLERDCAVVISDPVCAEKDIPALTHAFQNYCTKQKLNVIYILVSEKFAHWAIQNVSQTLIQVAEELIVDPQIDPTKGRKGEKLRWKVNQARNQGIEILEYTDQNPHLENQLKEAANLWLQSRKGPQIYLGEVDLFSNREGTRWLYAKKDGTVIGVLMLKQIDLFQGWVLNFSMALPNAPTGTSEFLIVSTIEKLREEECHFFSLGAGPGTQLGEIVGLGRLTAFIVRHLFRMVDWIFHLQRRRIFFKKFMPKAFPSYVLFNSKIKINSLLALMRTMNVSYGKNKK